MTRRNVITGIAGTALAATGAGAANKGDSNVYLELKRYQLRTTPEEQSKRLGEFLQASYAPAIARAGGKLIGAFANYIGIESPQILTVTEYDSLATFESAIGKLTSDGEYQRGLTSLESGTGYPFQRIESSLHKTFDGMPKPLLSDASDSHGPRLFELRQYESQTEVTLARKVKMFDDGEIGIFQRLGMRPVFFGQTLVGRRMPNLVYMLSFDSLAAREELWKKFGSDPEWKKISSPAELHDDKIVSNISNTILRPLSFSLIR